MTPGYAQIDPAVLVNITNTRRWEFPFPNKAEKLDDLSEPSTADKEENYRIELED